MAVLNLPIDRLVSDYGNLMSLPPEIMATPAIFNNIKMYHDSIMEQADEQTFKQFPFLASYNRTYDTIAPTVPGFSEQVDAITQQLPDARVKTHKAKDAVEKEPVDNTERRINTLKLRLAKIDRQISAADKDRASEDIHDYEDLYNLNNPRERKQAEIDVENAIRKNRSIDANVYDLYKQRSDITDELKSLSSPIDTSLLYDFDDSDKVADALDYLDQFKPNGFEYGDEWHDDESNRGTNRTRYKNGVPVGSGTFWRITDSDDMSAIAMARARLADLYGADFDKHIDDLNFNTGDIEKLTQGEISEKTNPRMYYAMMRYKDIQNLLRMRNQVKRAAANDMYSRMRRDSDNGVKLSRSDYHYGEGYQKILDRIDKAIRDVTTIKVSDEALEYAENERAKQNAYKSYERSPSYDFEFLRNNTNNLLEAARANKGAVTYDMMKDYLGIGKGQASEYNTMRDLPPPGDTKIEITLHVDRNTLNKSAVWCGIKIYDDKHTHQEEVPDFAAETSVNNLEKTDIKPMAKESLKAKPIESPYKPKEESEELPKEEIDNRPEVLPSWFRQRDVFSTNQADRDKRAGQSSTNLISEAEQQKAVNEEVAKDREENKESKANSTNRPIAGRKAVKAHDFNEKSEDNTDELPNYRVNDKIIPAPTKIVHPTRDSNKKVVDKSKENK